MDAVIQLHPAKEEKSTRKTNKQEHIVLEQFRNGSWHQFIQTILLYVSLLSEACTYYIKHFRQFNRRFFFFEKKQTTKELSFDLN